MEHFAAEGRHSRLNPTELDVSESMPAGNHFRDIVDVRETTRRPLSLRLSGMLGALRRN